MSNADQISLSKIKEMLAATTAPRFSLPLAYTDPAFIKCMDEACCTAEFITAFDKLSGCKIGNSALRSSIDSMVDNATGFRNDQMRQFVEFVHDSVYLRLPDEAINAFRLASIIEHDQSG